MGRTCAGPAGRPRPRPRSPTGASRHRRRRRHDRTGHPGRTGGAKRAADARRPPPHDRWAARSPLRRRLDARYRSRHDAGPARCLTDPAPERPDPDHREGRRGTVRPGHSRHLSHRRAGRHRPGRWPRRLRRRRLRCADRSGLAGRRARGRDAVHRTGVAGAQGRRTHAGPRQRRAGGRHSVQRRAHRRVRPLGRRAARRPRRFTLRHLPAAQPRRLRRHVRPQWPLGLPRALWLRLVSAGPGELAAVLRRPVAGCRALRVDVDWQRGLGLAGLPLRPLGPFGDRVVLDSGEAVEPGVGVVGRGAGLRELVRARRPRCAGRRSLPSRAAPVGVARLGRRPPPRLRRPRRCAPRTARRGTARPPPDVHRTADGPGARCPQRRHRRRPAARGRTVAALARGDPAQPREPERPRRHAAGTRGRGAPVPRSDASGRATGCREQQCVEFSQRDGRNERLRPPDDPAPPLAVRATIGPDDWLSVVFVPVQCLRHGIWPPDCRVAAGRHPDSSCRRSRRPRRCRASSCRGHYACPTPAAECGWSRRG